METHDSEENKEVRELLIRKLAFPEKLDSLLVVASPRVWIALGSAGLLFVSFILWSIFGEIPVKVRGKGIILNPQGLFSIQAQASGNVRDIFVKAGEPVVKGSLLMDIFDSQENIKLKTARKRAENLQSNLLSLKEQVEVEGLAVKEATERELDSKVFASEQMKEEVGRRSKSLEAKKGLYEEGLLNAQAVRDAEQYLMEQRISLENIEASILTLRSDLAKEYRVEEVRAMEQSLLSAEQDLDILKMQEDHSSVESPSEGKILEVMVNEGDNVRVGDALAWGEFHSTSNEPHVVYGYVPVEMGKKIEKGSRVQMELSTVNPQKYGFLLGTVQSISHYAVSSERVAKTIPHQGLVEHLLGATPMIQIKIALEKDELNPSSYKWTSHEGPPESISTGTICKLKVVVEKIRPIHFIFPFWNNTTEAL